jgi:hypothetical protein
LAKTSFKPDVAAASATSGAAVLCGADPFAASVLAKFATETPVGIEMQTAVSAAMGDCRTIRTRNPFGLDE